MESYVGKAKILKLMGWFEIEIPLVINDLIAEDVDAILDR